MPRIVSDVGRVGSAIILPSQFSPPFAVPAQSPASHALEDIQKKLPPEQQDNVELAHLCLMVAGVEPASPGRPTAVVSGVVVERAKEYAGELHDANKLQLALDRVALRQRALRGELPADLQPPDADEVVHRIARPPCIKRRKTVMGGMAQARPPRSPCVAVTDNYEETLRYNCVDMCEEDKCPAECCRRSGISVMSISSDMVWLADAHRSLFLDIVSNLLGVYLDPANPANPVNPPVALTDEEVAASEEMLADNPDLELGRARALSLSPERAREIMQVGNLQWSIPACFSAAETDFEASCRCSMADDDDPNRTHKVLQPDGATVLQMCKHAMALCNPWQPCRFFMRAAAEPIDFTWRPPLTSPAAEVIFVALHNLADYLAALYANNKRDSAHGDLDMLFVVNEAIWRLCSGTAPELTSKRASTLGFKGVVLKHPDARLLARALALPSLREWHSYSECLYMVAASLGEDAGLLDKRPTRRAYGINSLVIYSNLSFCAVEKPQHDEYDPDVTTADQTVITEGERTLAGGGADSSGGAAATAAAAGTADGTTAIETGFYSDRVRALRKRRYVVKPQRARNDFDITAEDLLQSVPDLGMVTVASDELADALPMLAHRDFPATFSRRAATDPVGALSWLVRTTQAAPRYPMPPLVASVQEGLRRKPRMGLVCGSASLVLNGIDKDMAENFKELVMTDGKMGEFVATWVSCKLREAIFEKEGKLVPALATSVLLAVPSPFCTLGPSLMKPPRPGYIVPPQPHNDVHLSVINLGRREVCRALGTRLALAVKEGLDTLRNVTGRRSSYMIWFVDDGVPFRLDQAILREQSDTVSWGGAQRWARGLLHACDVKLATAGLRVVDVENEADGTVISGVSVQAIGIETKRMVLIAWDRTFAQEASAASRHMLRTMWVAHESEICLTIHATPTAHAWHIDI